MSVMPRWMTVTLRCWIAFIAFTNLGASFRCFTAYNFVHSKFFGIETEDNITNSMTDLLFIGATSAAVALIHHEDHLISTKIYGPFLERMYGFWSLMNGIILLTCFHFIEDRRIIGLSICAILLYLLFFSLEGVLFKTVLVHGPTIYPFVLSAVTLLWLICGFVCLCYPNSREEYDENEVLRKHFPFKGISRKGNKNE